MSLQIYTHIFSLEVKIVEILTDLNWKWKWGSENIPAIISQNLMLLLHRAA